MELENKSKIKKLRITKNLYAFAGCLSLTGISIGSIAMTKEPNVLNGVEVVTSCLLAAFFTSCWYEKNSELVNLKNNEKKLLKIK